MNTSPARSYTIIAVAIVIAGVLISASLFASVALRGTVTKTTTEDSTETATTTLTAATTTTVTNSGSAQTAQPGPLLLSKSWGPWVYNVSLSATLINPGQFLFVSSDLIYAGQSNTTIAVGEPPISIVVYNSTGGVVWEFVAPLVTSSNATLFEDVYPGRNLGGGQACIPISVVSLNNSCSSPHAFNETPQSGAYTMQIEPPFYSLPSYQDAGANLTITADFTIISNSSLVVSQTATETSIQCIVSGPPAPCS